MVYFLKLLESPFSYFLLGFAAIVGLG